MVYTVFINLLPRHIAKDYFKLKSLSSKIQRTSSSIGFINQALFDQITPTFAKVKGHFGSLKDKYSAEKSILISLLVEHEEHLKKLDSYKILVINLSTENLDTKPLRYGLHHSYVGKNKNVKRNVATKLESLSIILDKYINLWSKENFHEYLRVATNIITKNIYNDHDNMFK